MHKRSLPTGKKGALLITTIVILAFVSALGLSLAVYLYSRTDKTQLELDRLKAFYLAEAGIAQSVHELRYDQDLDGNGVGNVLKMKLGGGSFKAFHNFQASTITGIGEHNMVKRTIQIKYSAL